jgi:hypothetical protein
MIRAIQFIGSIGVISVLGLTAYAGGSLPGWCLQFGALGLCGYMVWRLHAQQQELIESRTAEHEELIAVIRKKDALLDRRTEELAALSRQNIAAYHRLADLLEDRPCLQKDHRIQGQ